MAMKLMSLSNFAALLIERTEDKFDSFLITESGSVKGTGKTTFSTLLSMEVCRQKGFKFELEESVIMDPTNEKIVDQVRLKPIAFPLQVDEASKVAYKRNYAEDKQKKLIIFINVSRKFYKIVNLNNPSFWGLDKDLLDSADFRIVILQRGLALVLGKSKNPEAEDKWNRKVNDEKIREYAKNQMNIEQIINALRNSPNYLFEIRFGEMDKGMYARYEKMSQENELQSFYETNQNTWRYATEALISMMRFTMRHKLELSGTDIARNVNWYLKEKKVGTALLPNRIREMDSAAISIGFGERLERMHLPTLDKITKESSMSSKHIDSFNNDAVSNNNKNIYSTRESKGGVAAAGNSPVEVEVLTFDTNKPDFNEEFGKLNTKDKEKDNAEE